MAEQESKDKPGQELALSPIQQAAVDEVGSLGKLFHMEASGAVLADVLTTTAFSGDTVPSPAQLVALVVVAKQYRLNPFTKEIYAFPDKKKGIVPIVGVDGWIRIINEQPMLDGIEFEYSPETIDLSTIDSKVPAGKQTAHEWIDCIITRKDRDKPIVVREYLDEVYRPKGNYDGPWQTHPKRFHRHKTLIQAARVAFGFAGIFDQDEAERVIEQQERELEAIPERKGPSRPQRKAKASDRNEQQERGKVHEAEVAEDANAQEGEEAEFEPVDDGPTDESPTDGTLFGQEEGRGGDDWTPEPGQASAGTIEFIRRKAEAKNYDAIDLCQHFELNALRGISEERAAEILTWLKTAPSKEAQPA